MERYKKGELTIEELFFWQKSFARTGLAFVDGLCFAMSRAVLETADQIQMRISRRKLKDLDRGRMSLEKRLNLAFNLFPMLYDVEFELAAGTSDQRAFELLTDCRELFTHPKQARDLRPPALLAVTKPAMEWVLVSWRTMLTACGGSMGFPVSETTGERRSQFREHEVAEFEARLSLFEMGDEDFAKRLSRVIFGLSEDTSRAMRAIRSGGADAPSLEAGLVTRNLILTLFSDIEGSVFALAHSLHKYCVG